MKWSHRKIFKFGQVMGILGRFLRPASDFVQRTTARNSVIFHSISKNKVPWDSGDLGYCSIVGCRAPTYFNIAEWDPKDQRKCLFAPPPFPASKSSSYVATRKLIQHIICYLVLTIVADPSALHSSIVSLISVQGVSERLNEKREQFWAACGISLPLIELSRDFHVDPFSIGCHIWIYICIMSYWKIKLSVQYHDYEYYKMMVRSNHEHK